MPFMALRRYCLFVRSDAAGTPTTARTFDGDVPPFVMVAQDGYGRPRGINAEGLKRRGFDATRVSAIKRAYRTLYVSGAKLEEALEQLRAMAGESDDVRAMVEFIGRGERHLLR